MDVVLNVGHLEKGKVIEKEINGVKVGFQILYVEKPQMERVVNEVSKTREELIASLHEKIGKFKKGKVLKYEEPYFTT